MTWLYFVHTSTFLVILSITQYIVYTIFSYLAKIKLLKYSKYLMDNIDLKIDTGYKFIKGMMNEKYNNTILKSLEFK